MTARVWPVDAVTGAPSYTGRSLRQAQVAPALAGATAARPLGGVSGVRPGTSNTIATATSTTWTVTPFAGSIDGEALAIAGPYLYAFDANVTGSVTAAAGSARIDRLDVQVSDPAESDGSSVPSIAVVYNAGVAGSGVPVAAPARSHPLALINVPLSGGGSPTVTWNATYTAAAGGIVQCTSSATYPTAATFPGLYIDDLTLGVLLRSNGTIWRAVSGAQASIIPTSVTVGSGSGAVGGGGVVTFTAASSVSINGCFTSTYDWYLLALDATTTGAANIAFVFRAAGTDNTTGYSIQRLLVVNTAANATQILAGTSSFFATIGVAGETSGSATIFNPARAVNTTVKSEFGTTASPMAATSGMTSAYSQHAVASAFDGITITCSTGTFTGTIRIYGYNNN